MEKRQTKLLLLVYLMLAFASMSAQTISFTPSNLTGESLVHPTALQFGPDGKLYVAQQDGKIFVYTVVRNAPNNYTITATETITLIQQIPNHNDDGSLKPTVTTRQVTGLLVTGTAASPVVYVSSSDPRIGGGTSGNSLHLDTNSGVLSKLVKNASGWTRIDLVCGLPRSEENHSTNGMQLDEVNNILYLCQGGNTNMGAPSNNFCFLSEYAYSAAILKINLNTIGNTTYNLPTLDDEDKPNISSLSGYEDNTDPFGGNHGKNQARLDPNGPVQIYSGGWRNHYDLVITKAGKMYSFDNGPNYGWGGKSLTDCSNTPVDPGSIYCDVLHYIPGQGYYAGHPNPTRANRANTFNISNPQSPVPLGMENPAECEYIPAGSEAHALTTICSSTNGMCEYTASNFSSSLKGNLLAAAFNGKIYRVKLNTAGDAIISGGQTVFASAFGATPLDVVAQGDADIFPGTVWAVTYGSGDITVFEPSDYAETNPTLIAYYAADKIRGGRLFDQFWAAETGFTNPVDASVNMNNVTNFPEFYRCKSCHAYDLKGRAAGFIDYPPLVNRPRVTGVNLFQRVPQMTLQELFDKVKHTGGALVDPARTADGTNNALGGNRMPDFGKLLTDSQVWDIVKFLKEGALNTELLYDVTVSGTYPTGTKAFSNIGRDGNVSAGLTFYNQNCASCHGANGRDGSIPNGLGGYINDDIGMSLGEFARTKPYELQHKAVFGEPGTAMHGVSTATVEEIKSLLKALANKNNFPDTHPVWYKDADGDGYGIPGDSSLVLNRPAGYTADKTDCDDLHGTVHPNAPEIRDGRDNDCNGQIDEGTYVWSLNVNAGGALYISAAADTFKADSYYTTPSTSFTSTYTGDYTNTDDDQLYKTERYGNFSYNIPVPEAGTYQVQLLFAESYSKNLANGKRVFHIDIEGTRAFSNFDIYAAAGGYTAITKTLNTMVSDGVVNIQFISVINNAKVSAVRVIQVNTFAQVYSQASAVNGGRLYNKFWSVGTGFVSPADATVDMNNITNFPEFYRCKSCHGYDQKGNSGAFIDVAPQINHPSVAGEIISSARNNSAVDLFAKIKKTGGAAVNPARTANGTNAALGGNQHPDYGKILSDRQILDIVKFLKEKALDTEQLYDINTAGSYPSGSKTFSNIGKNGDAVAGASFFSLNCASCHGGNGRDGAYFEGLSLGYIARTEPDKMQHLAVFGNPGTSMYGVNDATISDIKNMLKALSDSVLYPDLSMSFFRDADGDGYGNPNDSAVGATAPAGYVKNNKDCNDSKATVYAGATEILDALDNNCNGQVDEGLAAFRSLFFNCGGPQYITATGDTFKPDLYYSAGSSVYLNNSIPDILNTADDALYKSERSGTTLSYEIPVSNGNYTVRLHFAEIYFGAPGGKAGGAGNRIFNVSLQEHLVLTNYDVFADAGGAPAAVVKEFQNVQVSDGILNIALTAVVNKAKISAISILPDAVTFDCHGDANGTAMPDDCGICSGGNSGHVANADRDCSGVCFGAALPDDCGICSGGNTGHVANSNKDCNGVCNGTAVIDDCGICSGGNTGHLANSNKDCNGMCGGTAVLDDCGICSGGNTGHVANSNKDVCGICFGNGTSCQPCVNKVTSLMLMHTGTAGAIGVLNNGAIINLAATGNINIRADVCDAATKSVRFKVNGSSVRVENAAPYSIAGDGTGGNYYIWSIAPGTYTIEAISYTGLNGSGIAGTPYSITITVINQPGSVVDCNGVSNGMAHLNACGICVGGNTGLTENQGKDCNGVCNGTAVFDNCGVCGGNNSTCGCQPLDVIALTLVRAGTASGDIGPLTNGIVLNKSQLGSFSIRADVCDGNAVKSVQFKLNGTVFRTENSSPFAMNGDKNGSYYAWNPAVGIYTLTVSGFSQASATGTSGAPMTVTFEVVAYSYKQDAEADIEAVPEINVYPNPNTGDFTVGLNVTTRATLTVEIFTQLSQSVYHYRELDYLGEFNHHISFEDQPSGVYFMRVQIGEAYFVRQVVIRRDQ